MHRRRADPRGAQAAPAGGFLVHAHRGGSLEPTRLTPALADVALRTIARLPVPTAYARVDLLDAGGDLVVSELELIEPDLALAGSAEATERFADSLLARATARSRPFSGSRNCPGAPKRPLVTSRSMGRPVRPRCSCCTGCA